MGHGKKKNIVLAYNGVDGFCAAASVLLAHPRSTLVLTSASKIGRTLGKLSLKAQPGSCIHICGVGFFCEWTEVERPVQELKEKGVEIIWYCGRGYLDRERERIASVAQTVFTGCASNTEAVCRHLGLAAQPRARLLVATATSDPRLEPEKVTEEIADWRDLIQASISAYLKYQDEAACPAAIERLARGGLEQADRAVISRYRQFADNHIIRGGSDIMKDLRRLIARSAEVDEPVILSGESGTGKEYAAQLIHEGSSRAGERFNVVNCAIFAGNPGLANSTLFGHVKGAFTGAVTERKGAFLSADGGTLFLDELGLLPLEVQGKLLRVLEEGMVVREGSDVPERVDVRIVAASNRDLPALIREGQFLPDLYHRINTLRVELPPLRAHPEDIPQIAREMLAGLAREGRELKLGKRDYALLAGYDWPGNVRQLFKLLKRMAYLGLEVSVALEEERRLGRLEAGGGDRSGGQGFLPGSIGELQDFEMVKGEYFKRAWELCDRNYKFTSQRIGVAVNTLRKYVSG